MGVNGFLISCAIRRATSAHAAVRWALTSSVMSSNVKTKPPTPESVTSRVIRMLNMRRSEEHTSELQSLMRISYAVFCLKTKTQQQTTHIPYQKLYKKP